MNGKVKKYLKNLITGLMLIATFLMGLFCIQFAYNTGYESGINKTMQVIFDNANENIELLKEQQ